MKITNVTYTDKIESNELGLPIKLVPKVPYELKFEKGKKAIQFFWLYPMNEEIKNCIITFNNVNFYILKCNEKLNVLVPPLPLVKIRMSLSHVFDV